MKKEVGIAIIFGILVGLILTFGVYVANTAIQKKSQKETMTVATPQPVTQESTPSSIVIFNPDDGMLVDKELLQISGLTSANAMVVVFVNDQEYITTADQKGNFTAEVKLVGGSNVLTTITTDQAGKQDEDTRVVVFSTANLDDKPQSSPSPSPSATPKSTVKPKASPQTENP